MYQKLKRKLGDGSWVILLMILGWPGGMLISIGLMMFGADKLSGYWALFSAASFLFLLAIAFTEEHGDGSISSTIGMFVMILVVVFSLGSCMGVGSGDDYDPSDYRTGR